VIEAAEARYGLRMKALPLALGLFALLFSLEVRAVAEGQQEGDFDGTTRFLFYSVLEGCYEDGLTNAEVDQILLKRDKQSYYHFIYACPICTATIWAFEAYRKRPGTFYSLKEGHSATFGPGLSPEQHAQLFSPDPLTRLALINSLVKDWMARRMLALRLTDSERQTLLADLEKKRERGMSYLKSFRKDGSASYAPAYFDLAIDECAVCNGAVGKPMKLPGGK
jgi:hypothetical protein